jgi:hypothetical protein
MTDVLPRGEMSEISLHQRTGGIVPNELTAGFSQDPGLFRFRYKQFNCFFDLDTPEWF